eukprot:6787762-Lingulodinium_polyedra.AAC.1
MRWHNRARAETPHIGMKHVLVYTSLGVAVGCSMVVTKIAWPAGHPILFAVVYVKMHLGGALQQSPLAV